MKWVLSPSGRYVRNKEPHGSNVCDLEVAPPEDRDYNGRLIAEAPYLLECCEFLLAILTHKEIRPPMNEGVHDRMAERVKSVIERVRGKR